MARQFNVDAPRSSFELPALTRQQIQSLMLDLDMDARQVVIAAIAQLWQREIATPDRDLAAEIDTLRMRLDAAGIAALPQRADTPSVALGQAPPMGGKELMMDLYIDAEVVGQESVGTQQQSIVRDNPDARAQGWILMEERHFSPSRGVGMRGATVQKQLVWGNPALIGSAGQTTWMKVDELLIRFV